MEMSYDQANEIPEHEQRALDAFRRSVTRKARQSGGTATANRWYGISIFDMIDEEPPPAVPKLTNPPRVRHWQRGGRLPFYATAPRSRKRR